MNVKKMHQLGIGLGLCLLSACSYMHQQQQLFTQQKMCVAQCEQRFQSCQQQCDENKKLCRLKSDARAAVHFARYQHQQNVQGKIVMEEVPSFRDPLACQKMTCDCDQDKMMCKQACRGSIRKRLQYAMQLK